jgi:hypothetical protein
MEQILQDAVTAVRRLGSSGRGQLRAAKDLVRQWEE